MTTTETARSNGIAPTITDVSERRRYEIAIDGVVVGIAEYRRRPGVITFPHTEIDPVHKGEGLGTLLVKAALDTARAEGLAVLPYCPFVKDFIDRHREYLDLVPVERRAKFALKDAVPPHTGDGRHRALLRIPQQSGRVVVDIGG